MLPRSLQSQSIAKAVQGGYSRQITNIAIFDIGSHGPTAAEPLTRIDSQAESSRRNWHIEIVSAENTTRRQEQ